MFQFPLKNIKTKEEDKVDKSGDHGSNLCETKYVKKIIKFNIFSSCFGNYFGVDALPKLEIL